MATVLYEVRDQIGYITLDRPEALNAINSQVRAELPEAYICARDDDEVRSVIVTSAGVGPSAPWAPSAFPVQPRNLAFGNR